jgi:hypothetical protein
MRLDSIIIPIVGFICGFSYNDICNYSIGGVVPLDFGLFLMLINFKGCLKNYLDWTLIIYLILCAIVSYILSGLGFMKGFREFYFIIYFLVGKALFHKNDHELFFRFAFLGALTLLVAELMVGHRLGLVLANAAEADYGALEDFRGKRILGAQDSFLILSYLYVYNRKLLIYFGLPLIFFITKNRTPVLAFIASYLIVNLMVLPPVKRIRLFLLAGLGFTLVGLFMPFYFEIFFKSLLPDQDSIGTTSFRIFGIIGAWSMFLSSPFFGVGLSVPYVIDYGFSVLEIAPHNAYLSILARTGIIGFLLVILWVLNIWKRLIYSVRFLNIESKKHYFIYFLSLLFFGLGYNFYEFGFLMLGGLWNLKQI